MKKQRGIRTEKGIQGEKRSHVGVGPQRDSWYHRVAENTALFL